MKVVTIRSAKFRFLHRVLQLLDQLPFFVGPGWNLGQTALVVIDEVIYGATVVVDDAFDGAGLFHALAWAAMAASWA